MEPKIAVGCPVQRRAWILPHYFLYLRKLDYPLDKLTFIFILDDSDPMTEQLVRDFLAQVSGEARTVLARHNYGAPEDTRVARESQRVYHRLAELRNELMGLAFALDNDYLFSCDSDILVPPYILTRLLSHNVDIVSALIDNDYGRGYIHNILRCDPDNPYYMKHIDFTPSNSLIEVDCTGACYLIHRRVYELGARYAYHPQGEDVGFAHSCTTRGIKAYCDTSLHPLHVMSPDMLSGSRRN